MDEYPYPVDVIRSNRKKTASVELDGRFVRVRVPEFLSEDQVRRLINQKSGWIRSKLGEFNKRPAVRKKEYVSGENFPILGKNHRLKVVENSNSSSVQLKDGYLIVTLMTGQSKPSNIQTLIEDWFRSLAEERLTEKTERYSKIIGVKPTSVSVKSYKSRWGSCSKSGEIFFNWKIIVAPNKIVDYVVIHELCHLREHNHSRQFWRHVERYAPDWKESRRWLQEMSVTFEARS